jgi:hypothetical protein
VEVGVRDHVVVSHHLFFFNPITFTISEPYVSLSSSFHQEHNHSLQHFLRHSNASINTSRVCIKQNNAGKNEQSSAVSIRRGSPTGFAMRTWSMSNAVVPYRHHCSLGVKCMKINRITSFDHDGTCEVSSPSTTKATVYTPLRSSFVYCVLL